MSSVGVLCLALVLTLLACGVHGNSSPQPTPVATSVNITVLPSLGQDYYTVNILFGVLLCGTQSVSIPVGSQNYFSGSGVSANLGQQTAFVPGWYYNAANVTVRVHRDVFDCIESRSSSLSWNLAGNSATVLLNLNKLNSFVPVVFGNAPTLCTQPSAGTQCSSIWTPPHPLNTQQIITEVPKATADARSLAGQNCLVIGGCRGLGLELTKAYRAAGCNTIATSRHPQAYDASVGCHPQWLDVARQDSIDYFYDTVMAALPGSGRLDILHFNPGIGSFGPAAMQRSQNYREALGINCFSLADVMYRSYGLMNLTANPYSKIFVTASASAYQPTPNLAVYRTSKVCLRSLMYMYNMENQAYHVLNGVPPKPPMITINPTGMATGWGVNEFYYPSSSVDFSLTAVGVTREAYLYGLAVSQPPSHVAEGVLNLAVLPSSCLQYSYILSDIYSDPSNPASDAGSIDVQFQQLVTSELNQVNYWAGPVYDDLAFTVDNNDPVRCTSS